MKTMKRALALLLCFVMVAAFFPATAFAADGQPNVTVTIDKSEFVAGDTVTVTLGVTEFKAASVAFGFDFDTALLEVSSITAARNAKLDYSAYDPDADEEYEDELKASSVSTKAEANASGHVGAVWVNTDEVTYLEKAAVITVKFTALADGAVVLSMFEDSSGSGSHKGEWIVGTPSEPEHECADNNNDHKCDECGEKLTDCADNNSDHKCDVCGEKLTDCADNNSDHKCDVCGEKLTDCADNNSDHKCDVCGEKLTDCIDENKDHKCDICGEQSQCADKNNDHYCDICGAKLSDHNYGDGFECACGHQLNGWQQKGENWYYVVNGKPVTGNVRVPYHKDYVPNADDVAYAQANADSKYTDATTAVFVFDENGVFQSDFTGVIGNRYAVNGVIAWHVGLVEIDGEYYYFIGDEAGNGNIAAEGDIYVSRLNGISGFEANGVYNFKAGKLSGLNGLVDRFGDGKLYYYQNSKLMLGNGLTQYGEELIYVRSNGQIATGKYWVAKTNGFCNPGMYNFGDNGFMQTAKDPNVNGLVDGIYYVDGMPYYAGLIEIDGDIYYINSAGEAVTGTYYITKLDNYTGSLKFNRGDKLTFGADGKLIIE